MGALLRSITFALAFKCFFADDGPLGPDEEHDPIHKRLRLSSEETDDPTSTPSAYSVVALPRKSSQFKIHTPQTLEVNIYPLHSCFSFGARGELRGDDDGDGNERRSGSGSGQRRAIEGIQLWVYSLSHIIDV